MNTEETTISQTTVGESQEVLDEYKKLSNVRKIQFKTTWSYIQLDEMGFWVFLPSHRKEIPKELQGRFTDLRHAAAALESYARANKDRPKRRQTPNYKKLHAEGKIKKAVLKHGEKQSNGD